MNQRNPDSRFLPPSRYSEEWWQEIGIVNLMSGDEWMREPGNLSKTAWIIWGAHLMELPATGGTPLFFPTAADCLYWFRWQVFMANEEFEGDDRDVKNLKRQIDSVPKDSDADRLLQELTPKLSGVWAAINFNVIESIHDHLSELGDVNLWRRAFRAPDIECLDGRWSLPPKVWESLREHFEPYEWGGGFDLEQLLDEEA